ncbi:MAG: energy-coupled thiamine transporter ThiT [Clostridiales bacterium]|nr:energy-coupled thiamine transporter ThiT [Clostridiales bacterium]
MRNEKLTTMVEGAIIAAIAVALSFIPINTPTASFDLSLGLIPLGVYALRRGLLAGMAVGLVWGLLIIALGKAFVLSVPQLILEYPVAFAFGGFGGILAGRLRRMCAEENKGGMIRIAVFSGVLAAAARWFFHFWAGVVFWGSYAPEGMSPYVYSFIWNGASAVVNAAVLAAILSVLIRTARIMFSPKVTG